MQVIKKFALEGSRPTHRLEEGLGGSRCTQFARLEHIPYCCTHPYRSPRRCHGEWNRSQAQQHCISWTMNKTFALSNFIHHKADQGFVALQKLLVACEACDRCCENPSKTRIPQKPRELDNTASPTRASVNGFLHGCHPFDELDIGKHDVHEPDTARHPDC